MTIHSPLKLGLVSLLLALPLSGSADTFFNDTFGDGSTLDKSPTTNLAINATSYQTAVGLSGGSSNLAPNTLSLSFPSTTSVLGEIMGLFTNSPIALNAPGDYIALTVVFTNTANILSGTESSGSTINIGLFNSGGVPPNQGHIVMNTGNTTGGSQNWIGYAARIFYSGKANIFTRPAQTPSGTTSQNQDLLFTGASSSQSFNSPAGTDLGTTSESITLTAGATYTLYLSITLTNVNALLINNTLYAGAGTGGTVLFTQAQAANGANYLTGGFNGLAIGWRNSSSPGQASTMTISSINVSGQVTPPLGPPQITAQPAPVAVPAGAAAAFSVTAVGSSVTYQWHRNGTNLMDGGNISGSTSSQLVISPASSADVLSGANGYYVTVTGAGNLSTNSMTNSLSLTSAKNLVWSGSGAVWDLDTSANWLNGATPATFNFGDSVTFNDQGANNTVVTITGSFLSASSFTISGSTVYNFSGSGSFAGPGQLIYSGSGFLSINNVNIHTGGTVFTNSAYYLDLKTYGGLGAGPLVLAKAGAEMEVEPTGSSSVGIAGPVVVADDFTIQFDGTGSYAGVFFGNLSGTAGKTLTLTPQSTSAASRYRVYGSSTVMDANLQLNGNYSTAANYDSTVLAPYNSSGTQVYNGIISGSGGVIQRGSGTTILNGANTYSGGTFPTTGSIGLGSDDDGSVGALGSGALLVVPELPNTTGSGQVFASGGAHTFANPIMYPSGTNNQTLIIGGTNAMTFSGAFTLNGNDGITSASINSRLLQVTNTAATIISGAISDSSGFGYGVTKTGSGALYLNGANTYSGATTNNSGSTNTSGLLAGAGSLAGPVFIQTNSAIGGGSAAAIGTLTINNNLTLAGNGWFRLNKSLSPANDRLSVSGNLANLGTGTITVTNLGPALAVGDKFTLFSKPVSGGNTMTVTGAGMIWTNFLAVDGSIQALAVAPTTANYPTNISFSLTGATLTIGWPATHQGWILQAQTNSLGVGLTAPSNSWTDMSATGNGTNASITINPANPTVFFRLRHP